MRPHIIRGTAAITVILATRITAITRATSALAGEATTGLGGGIDTTAGIMADRTGGADAAGTVVVGTVVAGMAADGVAIIDSESRPRCPRVFSTATTHAARLRGIGHAAIRCDIASKVPVAWPESEYRSNDDSVSKVLLSRYGIFFMRSPRNSVTKYVGLGSGAQVPTKGGVLENPNLGTCDALVSV